MITSYIHPLNVCVYYTFLYACCMPSPYHRP